LKKPAGSIWFRFYKQKTEKPNRNRKKPSQTGKTEPNRKNQAKPKKPSQNQENRAKPVFFLKNRSKPKPVGLTGFRFGFGFFKKKMVWLLFLIKTEPKMITPNSRL